MEKEGLLEQRLSCLAKRGVRVLERPRVPKTRQREHDGENSEKTSHALCRPTLFCDRRS